MPYKDYKLFTNRTRNVITQFESLKNSTSKERKHTEEKQIQ